MDPDQGPKGKMLHLNELNPHLLCVLCGGYYVEATTICECLHSFCKSCIVRHLETSKFCPICDVQLHKTKPLLSIRPDRLLQRLVFRMVPDLYESELQRRQEFYSKPGVEDSERHRDLLRWGLYEPFSPDDSISLSLEYYDSSKASDTNPEDIGEEAHEGQRRYLQCPAAVTMRHLKKFLGMKYGIKNDHQVDIYYQRNNVPDLYSLIDVAYTYHWDRMSPMRFGFVILQRQPLKATDPDRVLVPENSSSSSLEDTPLHSGASRVEEVRSEQTEQIRDLGLGKKKLRENTTCNGVPEESAAPAKKSRISELEVVRRRSPGSERTNNIYRTTESSQSVEKGSNNVFSSVPVVVNSVAMDDRDDSSDVCVIDDKDVESQASSPERVEDEVMLVEEGSQGAEFIDNGILSGDARKDIENVIVDIEGEPSQDFILQEEEPIDISEDLEEDDDEDRLRICDPEEIPEERNADEKIDEQMETEPVHPEVVVDEKLDCYVEEETEVVRKESKTRKKNKKAKHHHRHKRDYSPAPEATIVPNDKGNDCMKLKVKLTRADSETQEKKTLLKQKNKQEDIPKSKSSDGQSPKQSRQRNYVIVEEMDNTSMQSPTNSNVDEDSRNSQSTDDHDVRSVASSKEGLDETSIGSKGSPLPNGNVESAKAKNRELSTKERLLQMRQVRHKNITPPPPRAPASTTISKVSAEEVCKKTQKAPIMLTSSSSSLTVSKVTAEEKMMMMTNNNLESKRPSLEIIMVNNPNAVNKINDNAIENQARQMMPGVSPVVKLMKSNYLNSMLPKQNSLSISKIKNSVESGKSSESLKNVKDVKVSSDKGRGGDKKAESFGALDLSGKSTRSGSSPALDGSNCPSPNQTALSMSQPLINRHLASMSSPHRSSSSSPPVSASVPKGSPTRAMQHPASMWNLMTLTDTAVHLRNMKAAQGQDVMKRSLVNNQKHPPQRYPLVSSPSRSPSSRASPTQLKIPTPNITISSKFLNRPKGPTNTTLIRPVGVNRPLVGLTRPMRSASPVHPSSSFAGMLSHSAAVAKKQAGINGRNHNIPPPPPAIPISTLYKMESMARKYDLEKIARGLSAANKAAAGIPSS